MKKILLGTTALAGLVFGASAFADDTSAMNVTIGGNSKFIAGGISRDKAQEKKFSFSPNQKSSTFFSSQKAFIKAEGKTDDLTYGAVIRLQTVANSANGKGDTRNDRSHIYVDTNAGSVELGSNFAVSRTMALNAGTIASGTGGASDGDAPTFFDQSQSYADFLSADNLSDRLDGRVEGARKISYISPTISGVQAGVSFTPDARNNGGENAQEDTMRNQTTYLGTKLNIKNIWSLALKYSNSFNDVDVALSATGNFGKFNNNATQTIHENTSIKGFPGTTFQTVETVNVGERNNLRSYAVGGVVGYNGFKLALSYGTDGDSLARKDSKKSDVKASWYTAGIAYDFGPGDVSLTYLNSKRSATNENDDTHSFRTTAYSLGTAYEVAPGFKPFAEVTYVSLEPKGYDKSKSTVYLVGTRIKF